MAEADRQSDNLFPVRRRLNLRPRGLRQLDACAFEHAHTLQPGALTLRSHRLRDMRGTQV